MLRYSYISIHIIDLWVRHISISGVYGPIATKFGMKANTKYALPSLGMTWDSDPTLLTRAPREGQGPSILYLSIVSLILIDDTIHPIWGA